MADVGDRDDDDVRRRRRRAIVVTRDGAGVHRLSGGLRLLLGARAQDDGIAGRRPALRQRGAEVAGSAYDRDGRPCLQRGLLATLRRFGSRWRNALGVLPSPLWGEGSAIPVPMAPPTYHCTTPTPALLCSADPPHKGEGRTEFAAQRIPPRTIMPYRPSTPHHSQMLSATTLIAVI